MTIAIAVKVNDGVVLASDSASTLRTEDGNYQVYNSADKIFNPYKGLPIGIVVYGLGSIGQASVSTLAKEFRLRITRGGGKQAIWAIDPEAYTLEALFKRFRDFIYDEMYLHTFGSDGKKAPGMGFLMAGYSSDSPFGELWGLNILEGGACLGPRRFIPDRGSCVVAEGQNQGIVRLLAGVENASLIDIMTRAGVKAEQIDQVMRMTRAELVESLVQSLMPIQEAIDLAVMLVELAVAVSRFKMGPQTVGGPVEAAAITKHEGFKWIRRKHYWPPGLNPAIELNRTALGGEANV